MAKRMIVVGDPTTHGGNVISGSDSDTIEGKPMARLGDLVSCPKHGVNAIVEGDTSFTLDGRPVALEGHHTACGSALIGTQTASIG
jgi:uncharacterized Zn-binding protein involved in type VI secretion